MPEQIKTGIFHRSYELNRAKADKEARTIPLSFSSEEPYERYSWDIGRYIEILDHTTESMDMSFISSGRAPVLSDHFRTEQVGVIESATIGTDRKGRAVIRFGKSEAAEKEFQDVLDGIRVNVSVGYTVSELTLEKTVENGPDIYRATSWKPLEVSIVAIPADETVGMGRNNEKREIETIILTKEFKTMPEIDMKAIEAKAMEKARAELEEKAKKKADQDAALASMRKTEADRVTEIRTAGEAYNRSEDAQKFIIEGKDVGDFMKFVADDLAKRGLKPLDPRAAELGLSNGEKSQYSLMRLVRSCMPNGGDAGFEREVSNAMAQKMGKDAQGFFVPYEVLDLKRDLNTTDDAALVGTDLLAGKFIDVLRNRIILAEAGATMLPGLVGNVAIPRQATGATVYWVTEGVDPTESEATFDTVTLSPKCVGTFTEITRTMMLQSTPGIENLVKQDLNKGIAVGIDVSGLHGSGASGQPTGIASVSGIGAVAGGVNGLAPTDGHIIDLESAVAVDNAELGTLAYITNAKVRGKLKKTVVESGNPEKVWDRRTPEAPLNGYKTHVTNQVSSALTKGTSVGVCSAIFYGNWSDLMVGMWGVLDILVNPYANDKNGGVRIRALQDIDIAVRHAESFSAMLDALTA